MPPRYKVGDKIVVTPVQSQPVTARDSELGSYAGQTGEVLDYHWLSPTGGATFYIYTVRIDASNKEAVLHEDEIEPLIP